MSALDPVAAPPRTDLPYLRRRSRRPAASPAVAEFFTGHASHPHHHGVPAPEAPQSPAGPPPRAEPAVGPGSSSLDLSRPPDPPLRAAPTRAPTRLRAARRVLPGTQTILTAAAPTVTLSRLQSGIGTLTVEAACSGEVGDLRLGGAYQLRSGPSSTVQSSGGNRLAPPKTRRPVIIGSRESYERLAIDLRQCRELERLAVYGFSESRALLRWGGTLVVRTFGGAEVEVPLENVEGSVVMLVTLYNVAGEFVVRAEMQAVLGDVREACRVFGYDKITWLDDRTPVA